MLGGSLESFGVIESLESFCKIIATFFYECSIILA